MPVNIFRSQTRAVLTKSTKLLTGSEMADLFPYKKDGTVFKNKEGLLPSGSYREYTVKTPESTVRGSRRVVFDEDSVRAFYTDDHYENFVEISP